MPDRYVGLKTVALRWNCSKDEALGLARREELPIQEATDGRIWVHAGWVEHWETKLRTRVARAEAFGEDPEVDTPYGPLGDVAQRDDYTNSDFLGKEQKDYDDDSGAAALEELSPSSRRAKEPRGCFTNAIFMMISIATLLWLMS